MKVLKTLVITDTNLTSSTVPETDYAEWLIGTTYGIGDRVIVLSTHKVYQSLQAGNTGNNPVLDIQNDPDNLPIWWVEISATNRWKAFDGLRNNVVIGSAPMTYVITPDRVTDVLMEVVVTWRRIGEGHFLKNIFGCSVIALSQVVVCFYL